MVTAEILGPPLEPCAQFPHRGRQDEDGDDVVAEPLAHLLRALPVDVEQHVASLGQHLLHGRARRAVAVAVHLRPFEQVAALLHPLVFAPVDKAVMDAVDLGGTARAGGDRDGQGEIERLVLHQHAGQRGLARARGRGQNQDHAAPARLRHLESHFFSNLTRRSAPARGIARFGP